MWESLIGAGIQSIAGLAGGAMSSAGAAAQNQANLNQSWQMAQFNAAEAAKNRDWQERMSSTAYQRAMADMKIAGLNPILAYQQGGAGTPGGATASGTAAHLENAMEGLGHGVTSAGKLASNVAALDQVKSTTLNQVSQADLNKANVDLSKVNVLKVAQDTQTSAAQAAKNNAEAAYTIEQMDNPKAARALMGAQSHSAFQAGEVSRREVEDAQKYGAGRIGREIGAPAEHMWDRLKSLWTSGKLSSPTDPRAYGLQGRPLTIDIRK